MALDGHEDIPMPLPHASDHPLLLQFVVALLQLTLHCPTAEAHQQTLLGFLDTLTPWLSLDDLPTLLAQPVYAV
jgi:hypothetical protein